MQRQLLSSIAIALLIAVFGACGGRTVQNSDVAERPDATVRIENRSFSDMRIYVVRSTQRIRLGMVTGNSTRDLQLPRHLLTGATSVQIIADPIGGRGTRASETFLVGPGDHITMTISPP